MFDSCDQLKCYATLKCVNNIFSCMEPNGFYQNRSVNHQTIWIVRSICIRPILGKLDCIAGTLSCLNGVSIPRYLPTWFLRGLCGFKNGWLSGVCFRNTRKLTLEPFWKNRNILCSYQSWCASRPCRIRWRIFLGSCFRPSPRPSKIVQLYGLS